MKSFASKWRWKESTASQRVRRKERRKERGAEYSPGKVRIFLYFNESHTVNMVRYSARRKRINILILWRLKVSGKNERKVSNDLKHISKLIRNRTQTFCMYQYRNIKSETFLPNSMFGPCEVTRDHAFNLIRSNFPLNFIKKIAEFHWISSTNHCINKLLYLF